LSNLATKFGERLLQTPRNPISMGMTLSPEKFPNPTFLGSMLFARGISGVRVVDPRSPPELMSKIELDFEKNANIDSKMGELKIGESSTTKSQEKHKEKEKQEQGSNNTGKKVVGGIEFLSYGSHYDNYPSPYLTAACAIGITKEEIDKFIIRLGKTIEEYFSMHRIVTKQEKK